MSTRRTFVEAGKDSAIITSPTYGMYKVALDIQGGNIINVPLLHESDSFALDKEKIIATCNDAKASVKIVFICSPNNPTGALVPKSYPKICNSDAHHFRSHSLSLSKKKLKNKFSIGISLRLRKLLKEKPSSLSTKPTPSSPVPKMNVQKNHFFQLIFFFLFSIAQAPTRPFWTFFLIMRTLSSLAR